MRSYFVLRHLSRQHTVTLLSFSRPDDPPQAVEHLRKVCHRVMTVPMQRSRPRDGLALVRSLFTGRSFIVARDDSLEMQTRVRQLLNEKYFDFIHSDQLWMAQYVLHLNVEALKRSNVRTVLDQHNAVHLIPKRMAANAKNPLFRRFLELEAKRLARYEAQVCQQFDHVVWVTKEDYLAVQSQQMLLSRKTADLKSPAPDQQSKISDLESKNHNSFIPICVDPSSVKLIHKLSTEPNILFIGGMHWPPNAEAMRWFIKEVFPQIRGEIPGALFYVVGKLPLQELLSTEGVVAPGYVEDLEPYWRQSRGFVAPLHAGGGMRVKILDAWAHNLPVISTSIGAEGLLYEDGNNIMIGDSPQKFAQAVLRVLSGSGLAERIGKNGRRWVEKHYDWRRVYKTWDEIYQQKTT